MDPHHSKPLWQDTAISGSLTAGNRIKSAAQAQARAQVEAREALGLVDALVVGAGFTGLWSALELVEAGLSVVVVDAIGVGGGASGRSGGQCNPLWRQTPDQLAQRLGERVADNLVYQTINSVDALFADLKRLDIECDQTQAGWCQAAHFGGAVPGLEALADGWQRAGARIQALEGGELSRVTGASGYSYALFHPSGGHVQPLSLARGLARAAVHRGVRIIEGQSVLALTRQSRHWQVRLSHQSLEAKQVVFATNAYGDLLPGVAKSISRCVVRMSSVILATKPLPQPLQQVVLPNSVTLSDTRRAIYYSRKDAAGRLLFGCIGQHENPCLGGAAQRLTRGLGQLFASLRHDEVERTWGGYIAMMPDLMPKILEPEPGIWAGIGFSGRGVLASRLLAKSLVKRLLGGAPETLAFPVEVPRPLLSKPLVQWSLRLAIPYLGWRDQREAKPSPEPKS